MPSFDRSYASSPVQVMQPQGILPVGFGKHFMQHQITSFSQPVSWHQRLVHSSSMAGRKRSRDEAAVNLDPPQKVVESPVIKEAEDEWVYGPGMTLIKKSASYIPDASSQSGTWVDEKSAKEEALKTEAALLEHDRLSQDRPSLRSHKSQRLEMAPTRAHDKSPSRRSSPTRDMANPLTASSDSISQPIVDDFTFHLGIGWSRLSEDEHIQAAARGWSRYIENHYPVSNAQIRLESRGLQSYLVEAAEGYFLFAENLRQGRLVSKTAEGALQNLKVSPPVFDGPETLHATETPKSTESYFASGYLKSSPTVNIVEMDMS